MSALPTPDELQFVGRLSASQPLVEGFPGAGLALSPAEWMLLTWFLGRHLNPVHKDEVGKSAEHPNLRQAEAIIKHGLSILGEWPAVLYDYREWLSELIQTGKSDKFPKKHLNQNYRLASAHLLFYGSQNRYICRDAMANQISLSKYRQNEMTKMLLSH